MATQGHFLNESCIISFFLSNTDGNVPVADGDFSSGVTFTATVLASETYQVIVTLSNGETGDNVVAVAAGTDEDFRITFTLVGAFYFP